MLFVDMVNLKRFHSPDEGGWQEAHDILTAIGIQDFQSVGVLATVGLALQEVGVGKDVVQPHIV